MTGLAFFAVGIDEYKKHDRLSHAVHDVEQVREILGTDPELIGANLTKTAVLEHLEKLETGSAGQSLMFYWAGHGESNGGLDLITSDDDRPRGKISAHEVVKSALESQAGQQLYVFDVCHSGDVIDLAPMIHEILSARQQAGPLWVGILASCRDFEQAQDGAFGGLLTRLLKSGPDDPDLKIYEWSRHRRFIDGEALGNAVLKEWPQELDQRPDFERRGDRLPMIRNPRFREDAPPVVVEHLLRAARSGAEEADRSAFTGRVVEVDTVVGWVTAGAPGCWVVTGPAGTGKSAIVGRVVSLSNPTERSRLMAHEPVLAHADPGEGSVAAHVYARGLTVDQVAAGLDEQLSGRDRLLLVRDGGPRNVHQLLGDLQEQVESGHPVPCVVVDGLDEAGGHATAISDELLVPLRRWATVIVSTREISTERGSLLDVLDPGRERLDLGAGDGPERTRRDVHAYLVSRLSGVSADMDAVGVADLVVARLRDDTFGEPFLFARLLADHLRDQPIDTSENGWEEQVALSYAEVFLRDISHPVAPTHRSDIDGPVLARTMLTALTWSSGSGFPVPEWMAVTRSLLTEAPVAPLDLDDVRWLLGLYGRFVIQDGEAGEAVYRLAHASLARALRVTFQPSASLPFDPASAPIAAALLGLYSGRLEARVPAASSTYLWRHAASHAAEAGPPGLELLSDLAALDGTLSPDLAAALLFVADRLGSWGLRAMAVAPTEEAVALYREQAATNPGYLPDLAMALNNLGIRYSEVGRRQDAVAPTEEAVALYREQAASNPGYLPDLAGALNNLGVRYSEVGRSQDAVAPTEEAVALRREQAASNPGYLPDLAGALNNLGIFYSEVGRRQDAVAPTEEAVALRREQAASNPGYLPDLAMALNNLGIRYSEVGRRQDAVAPTEEAVALYREQAASNPGYLPNLAMALNNLGVRYSEVGRRQDAIAPTEEAVALYREQAASNPGYLPNLAMALNNLGNRYSEVGRRQDAVAPTEEAVALYREQAASNPGYLPDLAMALNNLGVRYSEVGRSQDAVAPTEEAVALRREQAASNPGYLPDLASALNNLGIRYSEVGRSQDAVAPTEEAVALRREQAATNPGYLPNLASALNNLGIRYSEVGRRQDAVAPTEEAVALYREQAATNPGYLPNLAMALNNLGVRYSEVGRSQDAIAPTEEAVALYREQAASNPGYLPNLAMALNNLGIFYSEVGRRQDAIAPTEEAVALYREQAATNPGYLPDLASALTNLGIFYSEVGRRQDAIAPTEEAVALYREQAASNPGYLPDLAMALNNLGNRYREIERPSINIEAAWEAARDALPPHEQHLLALLRARAAESEDQQANQWLIDALVNGDVHPAVARLLRDEARRRHVADAATWAASWESRVPGALPGWMSIPTAALAAADAWVRTATFEDERDYLRAHPELLHSDHDAAVEEAMMVVPAEERDRLRGLRKQAVATGVDEAYRPLLRRSLAAQFLGADPAGQARLFETAPVDLRSPEAQLALRADPNNEAGLLTADLLTLEDATISAILAAARSSEQFTDLLPTLARRQEWEPHAVAVAWALSTGVTTPDILFHMAIEMARQDTDEAEIRHVLTRARASAPDQVPSWITWAAHLIPHDRRITTIIGILAGPLPGGTNRE